MNHRVDPGYRVLTLRRDPWGVRIGVRHALAVMALLLGAFLVAVVSLGTGDYPIALQDVVRTLLGQGTPRMSLVVLDWRMPRVLLALTLGAALGAAGAIFQSLTRNPLGSPDIIGFDSGAFTGALLVISMVGTRYLEVAGGAVAGGLATAALIYLLAYRKGFQGFRLIIVGIGVSAVLSSFNTWIILNAELYIAMAASAWGSGSLNTVSWSQTTPVLFVLAALWVLTALVARRMSLLELGDDAAVALGLRSNRVRLALVVLGVALTATATAAAGPIAFVSLAAPQLARRMTRAPGVTLAASAAMGALLLSASDYLAQRIFAPTQLPVGVVTVALGGLYLVWLLISEARRRA